MGLQFLADSHFLIFKGILKFYCIRCLDECSMTVDNQSENSGTKVAKCRFCSFELYSIFKVVDGYHLECYRTNKLYHKLVWDQYGENHELFLPKDQLQFVEEFEQCIQNSYPKAEKFGQLPIIEFPFNNENPTKMKEICLERKGNELYAIQINYWNRRKSLTLPESINNLHTVEEVRITNANFISLPKFFCDLPNLKRLLIEDCKLIDLPEEIGNLKNLEILYLSETKLTTLPNSIGKLSNLKKLFLLDNKIETVPDSVKDLKNLKRISLFGYEFVFNRNWIYKFPESVEYGILKGQPDLF